jgi:hypothetical protein
MRITRDCWKCEYPECGHIWIATGEDPPEQCAKCKKRKWHTPGSEEVVEVSAPARKSNGKLNAHDKKRMAELNGRFDEHLQDEMEKPSRLARIMASVPEVRPAAEILAPQSIYQRPAHAANCGCLSCRPPKGKE